MSKRLDDEAAIDWDNFQNHPERKTNERWVTNFDPLESGFFDRYRAKYPSARQGSVALDVYGKAINGRLPIFVDKEEFKTVNKREFNAGTGKE